MRGYFIIFPHAGAIRSGYSEIEGSVSQKHDVLYVDYGQHIIHSNICFDCFLDSIWHELKRAIVRKNAEIFLFGHSMGSCVLQALESKLASHYFVEHICHSDGDTIDAVTDTGLRYKTVFEQQTILESDYDIPNEIRSNGVLLKHFETILIRDLLLLDTIPAYVKQYGVPRSISDNTDYIIALSDYMDYKRSVADWERRCPSLPSENLIKIDGGHYSILSDLLRFVLI
ncbi:hypothetical protein AGMMS50284_6480 [Clostridia bacterium]|nr:hypothetical protein AGMMS50284_6480 [Clostridia bacterium]